MLFICDWTQYQGVLEAAKVQAEGFTGVKLKVGGGNPPKDFSFVDPYFVANGKRLLAEAPSLLRMCYWYLVPGNGRTQAALMLDTLEQVGSPNDWHIQLDCEATGVRTRDIEAFVIALQQLVGHTLTPSIYTRKNWWQSNIDRGDLWGAVHWPVLEEAHWIEAAVRADPGTPYASQQAHFIDSTWWSVSYSGWKDAALLQFTDHVKVVGKYTCCTAFKGTKDQLRRVLGQ